MADHAGTSSAPPKREQGGYEYDVFLTFRGMDTRFTITSALYSALTDAGVRVFRDEDSLRPCEPIEEQLSLAITNSRIYIPILSKNYASSRWCLWQLRQIVECWRNPSSSADTKRVILPVFYDVSVSKDLKLRSDEYLAGLEKHKDRFGDATVESWEAALNEVALINGWSIEDLCPDELIYLIKKEVISILNPNESIPILPDRLVGIHDRIEAIMPLLERGSPHLRYIVIHGMGGIIGKITFSNSGKTNLADSIVKKNSRFQDELRTSSARVTTSRCPSEHDDPYSRRTTPADSVIKKNSCCSQDQTEGSSAQATSRSLLEHVNGKYDVFISFRGPDSRHTVVNVLYHALTRAGIRVFYDDEEIRKGEVIEGELLSAITNSRIYITIFSRDYASSHWCLRELEKMVELWRNSSDGEVKKVILPIFYDVDISKDLKLESNVYSASLKRHKERFGNVVVEPWEAALKEVKTISGWNLNNYGLNMLTNLVVEEVCGKLWTRSEGKMPKHLVGIHDPMEGIMKSLSYGTSDVRFLVIHGLGGIGKITLARVAFDKISSHFQGCCVFLSDVRESSRAIGGIVNLQQKLLSEILNLRSLIIRDAHDGANMIKERLKEKKVLIVLDNLDKSDQLMKLAGAPTWFGKGSRIIITTRNIDFLVGNNEMPSHDENIPTIKKNDHFYFRRIEVMTPNDALEFFSKLVFKSDSPPSDYVDISREVVATTGRLPLAIEVIGPLFYCIEKNAWVDKLEKLKKVVHKDVREKLMISYDDLDSSEKEIFLDIACLFINKEKIDATYYWEARELFPKIGINVLISRSLIKIIDGDKLWMHDLLRDLGRNIVNEGNGGIPGRRSRLWSPNEAFHVVRRKKVCICLLVNFNFQGTGDVVALKLGTLNADCCFTHEQFVSLTNLNFLELDGGKLANEKFDEDFSELKWLSWNNCPEFRATNLCFENLVVLKLSESIIANNWGGWVEIMAAEKLKVLNCTYCRCLTKTPDFSAFPKLERLIFKNCLSLKEIDSSIGKLEKLDYLEITNPLFYTVRLPGEEFSWQLKEGQPQILSDSIGGLKSLSVLKLKFVNLSVLSASIGELVNLKHLCLWCPELAKLPDSIGNLKSLVELDISFTAITKLPEFVINLESLRVFRYENSWLREVPDWIQRLVPPRELDMFRTEPAKFVEILTNM